MIAGTSSYAPTVLCGTHQLQKARVVHHWHHFYRLIAGTGGWHQVHLDGGAPTDIGEGGVYLLPGGVDPVIEAGANSTGTILAFSVTPCAMKPVASGRPMVPVDPDHRQPSPRAVWDIDLPVVLEEELARELVPMIRLVHKTWWLDEWHKFQADMRLAEILERIVMHYRPKAAVQDHGLDDAESDFLIGRVLSVVERSLSSIRTVEDLATMVGMGVDHFAHEFRRQAGQSPAAFLRERRLDEAETLLRTTQQSPRLIALSLGWASQNTFNRAWKRRHEMAPLAWRRAERRL